MPPGDAVVFVDRPNPAELLQEIPYVEVGLSKTADDEIGRLELVYSMYKRRGYLKDEREPEKDMVPIQTQRSPEEVLNSGLMGMRALLDKQQYSAFLDHGSVLAFADGRVIYIDKYQWQSQGFVAYMEGKVVASSRLIFNLAPFGLPTLRDPKIKIDDQFRGTMETAGAEISQFTVSRRAAVAIERYAGPFKLSLAGGIIRYAIAYSSANGIKVWAATGDNSVTELLNGTYFHLGMTVVGPAVDYLGSPSLPLYINLPRVLENAARHPDSKNMSAFMSGVDGLPGSEWYNER